MSFITKRERVFNEYDLFDLPARNEGKLKAYASCTDARAWSHFCSDKTEHLVEIIKRNNETCRTKYLPTDVIVNTLMLAKNAEISRLKRKIDEFEQILAAYDQLELTYAQKCEIAEAHIAIKAANKELDELCLELDLSGFTEGIDSEAFMTGKSRGDESGINRGDDETGKSKRPEWSINDLRPEMDTIGNQVELPCPCDATTSAHDPRIAEMQETIICKDAKLSAMQNTIAVMENDVCEPYCIYAHIYTALEKIFGTLCQNQKYKQYLDLLSSGKDTRGIDIKGRILFKLKVLEKFCVALIAPCSQEVKSLTDDCSCYRAEIISHVETTLALTSAEFKKSPIENKRAQLVADIMENEEMKEILSKEGCSAKCEDEQQDEMYIVDNYSIDAENLNRLKSLQVNYDELMTCYENLKHEKDCLKIRCHKFEELEKEYVALQNQLREYNTLWNEKEHYRKRSEDLDSLKEQYLVLSDETCNLETQLKAETEINSIKMSTIDDLRCENIDLEKKLNEETISFEKEKNAAQCKLKETECKVMCQEQQIKSLSAQIDRLLEQDDKILPNSNKSQSLALIDEMESLKDQIKNLKNALYCNEEEKQQLQEQFQDKLNFINALKMQIEDWKSTYEKTLQRNDYLEKYTEDLRNEVHRLTVENKTFSQNIEEKTAAVDNLIHVINNKSLEVNKLMEEIDQKTKENLELFNQLKIYDDNVVTLEDEKYETLNSLQLAKQESQELLEKLKDYNDVMHENDNISKSLDFQVERFEGLQNILKQTIDDNKKLQMDLNSRENNNAILLQEIQRLREINGYAVNNITSLQDEKNQFKTSLELTKKESEILSGKLMQFEDLREKIHNLEKSNEKLFDDKKRLRNDLRSKSSDLDNAIHSNDLSKKESLELMHKLEQSKNSKEELRNLSESYKKLANENREALQKLAEKNREINSLINSLKNLETENGHLQHKFNQCTSAEQELAETKKIYDELLNEKNALQIDFDNKTEEYNNIYNTLEGKIEENRDLLKQIKSLQNREITLKDENSINQNALLENVKYYENIVCEFDKLKLEHDQMKSDKERLERELMEQIGDNKKLEKENRELNSQTQNLITHNGDLEQSLINTRNELMSKSPSNDANIATIIKEIDNMKKEKVNNHMQIRDLLNKIEETETTIANLSEQVLSRNGKIAVLENHINSLEDEVRRLHNNLAEVVDTGEEIKEHSYKKIDQSLNIMEAHHSKATHNMKMELAKLQNNNAKLEEQLSFTKIKSEESFKDKHKYISQLIHLQNEREIIVTDIKQLEIISVGDTLLSPENCNVEDILKSLDRIRKCLDAKNSKSTTLEQTLLKVQTSSQLLLSKADEAKRLVEKEIQKIIKEKEEAVVDRLNIEKQLLDLKAKLEKQINDDQAIIKDLQGEILNQKLIIDKINKSTQNYVLKLEEEMQSLQDMYQNSLEKVSDLQGKVNNLSADNNKYIDMIEKINKNLEQKSADVAVLQNTLHELKNKSGTNIGVQTHLSNKNLDVSSQTEKIPWYDRYGEEQITTEHITKVNADDKKKGTVSEIKLNIPKQPNNDKQDSELMHNVVPQFVNEVQILTANVGPSLNFMKNAYLDYKLKRLSQGRLEQYSISCLGDTIEVNVEESLITDNLPDERTDKVEKTYADIMVQNSGSADMFNAESMYTGTSKRIGKSQGKNQLKSAQSHQSTTKSSALTGLTMIDDIFEMDSHITSDKYKDDNLFIESTSAKSTDKDLFVIYRDSESSHADGYDDKDLWLMNEQTEVETTIVEPRKKNRTHDQQKINKNKKTEKEFYHEAVDHFQSGVLKPKLNIAMPRVETETFSLLSITDSDKKSCNSDILAIYSSVQSRRLSDTNINNTRDKDTLLAPDSKKGRDLGKKTVFAENNMPGISNTVVPKKHTKKINDVLLNQGYNRANIVSDRDTNVNRKNFDEKTESHHRLSRIGANFVLMTDNNEANKLEDAGNFGLEFILDTMKREGDPSSIRIYNTVNALRKSKSDQTIKIKDITLSPISSIEYKTETSKSGEKSPVKSGTEHSVMVKIEGIEDYENQIKYLTGALENIEKDYKKKIEAIKVQYDSNIKHIIKEHNQGVSSIQSLHEETLQDVIKIHENEVENLRSMSIEAMRKAEKLEKENRSLKTKTQDSASFDEVPIKMPKPELKTYIPKCRGDTRMLTKTNVEAFNVNPKLRNLGPCTCSLDINVSDTIRNIFKQVDVDQRKLAEHTYLKYIANKLKHGQIEGLDAQELSFLHLKVCRTWKTKLSKEEALQTRIDTLENELMSKQRHAQQHIAELDRKVAEERRRLQEVREAVCRTSPNERSSSASPARNSRLITPPPAQPSTTAEKDFGYNCNIKTGSEIGERQSAGDLIPGLSTCATVRVKRPKVEPKLIYKVDVEERREKKLYNDEPPTRLRRPLDRPLRAYRK